MFNDILPDIPDKEIMTLEDLKNIFSLQKALEHTLEAYKSIDYDLVKSFSTSEVRVTGSKNHDRLSNKVIDINRQKEQLALYIATKTEEIECYKLRAISIINRIPSLAQREVLVMRYIELKSWKDISEERFADISSQFDLHNRAIKSFMKIQYDYLS